MKNDSTLVKDALDNGAESFSPIVERYKDAVFGVALMRVRNFEDAEDVAQTAFMTAYERLRNLRDPNRLGAWLRSIAIHQSLDHIRRHQHREDVEGQSPFAVSNTAAFDDHIERDRREQVMQAIDLLSKVQKESVILYYISGYSQKEIAAMQEVPVGTVKYRLHEARQKLKQEMVDMVEEVLKDGAPKEDFAERVFELIFEPPDERKLWREDIRSEIEKIGSSGMDGFVRALNLPQWQTRRTAIYYITAMPCTEQVVDLLKNALADNNRNVRQYAAGRLLNAVDVSDERMRDELVPLVAQRLLDPSIRVRRNLSLPWIWGDRAVYIPLETIARAIAYEKDPIIIERMQRLLQVVLEARNV